MGEGIKTYQDGSAKRGKWEGGVFIVISEVEEGDNNNLIEAAKPIDANMINPGAYQNKHAEAKAAQSALDAKKAEE